MKRSCEIARVINAIKGRLNIRGRAEGKGKRNINGRKLVESAIPRKRLGKREERKKIEKDRSKREIEEKK